MTTQATKRPWKISRPVSVTRDFDEEAHYIRGNANDGWPVCANTGENDLSREEQLANALLIVKAVNCHDELVEALKIFYDKANAGRMAILLDLKQAKQALAKAGA